MFVANNNIVLTGNGSSFAQNINNKKILTTTGMENVKMQKGRDDTIILKTTILPSFLIGIHNKIYIGEINNTNNKITMKNVLKTVNNIKKNDYLIIPKIHFNTINDIKLNKTICLLYLNFIFYGYITKNRNTKEDLLIINYKNINKQELNRLKSIKNLTFNNNKQIIYITNKKIINFCRKYTNNIPLSIYNSDKKIQCYFLYTLNKNLKYGKIKKKTIAFDLFLFLLSNNNKVYKIIENKTITLKNKNKAEYILIKSNNDDFIEINDLIYIKITNIIKGNNVSGVEFNSKNYKIHLGSCIVL